MFENAGNYKMSESWSRNKPRLGNLDPDSNSRNLWKLWNNKRNVRVLVIMGNKNIIKLKRQ